MDHHHQQQFAPHYVDSVYYPQYPHLQQAEPPYRQVSSRWYERLFLALTDEKSIVDQAPPYISTMGQGHHGRMVARPEYYDVVPAIQPPPVHRAGPEMLQPSPISHAPIPFLNAYYTDTGAFQPRDDPVDGELAPSYYASTVSTTDYYHDSRDAPPPPTGMAQPWVEPVSEPYSVQTFQTPSELMAQLCASDDSRAGTGYSETIDTALRSTFSASPEAKDDSTTPEASETANTRPNSRVSQSSSSISILPDAPPAKYESLSMFFLRVDLTYLQ